MNHKQWVSELDPYSYVEYGWVRLQADQFLAFEDWHCLECKSAAYFIFREKMIRIYMRASPSLSSTELRREAKWMEEMLDHTGEVLTEALVAREAEAPSPEEIFEEVKKQLATQGIDLEVVDVGAELRKLALRLGSGGQIGES